MVRAAKGSVADARADADERRRHVGIAHVVLDLLQRPRREKAGRRHAERLLSRRGQSGRDADQVLLGDADFDDLLRQRLAERPEFSRTSRIARDGDDIAISSSKFFERRCKFFEIRASLLQT